MAKDKSKTGVKNKHLHARIAFLHQAAAYLTEDKNTDQNTKEHLPSKDNDNLEPEPTNDTEAVKAASLSGTSLPLKDATPITKPESGGLPLYLTSHLSQVARKSQIRLNPEVKHTICKRCGTVQVEGTTCKNSTENLSRGGKKLHASVLVQECGVCGMVKRWPVGAKRQPKKAIRRREDAKTPHISDGYLIGSANEING